MNDKKFTNMYRRIIIFLSLFLYLPILGYSQTDDIGLLINMLKNTDSLVRQKAAEALALGNIKDPRVVEPLIAALKDEDPLVREKAAEALGYIKDPRVVEPLIAALKDEDTKQQSRDILMLSIIMHIASMKEKVYKKIIQSRHNGSKKLPKKAMRSHKIVLV